LPPRAPTGEDLDEQAAERVTDDGRLAVEAADDLLVVSGHLTDRL
jgi:hypothetical protein